LEDWSEEAPPNHHTAATPPHKAATAAIPTVRPTESLTEDDPTEDDVDETPPTLPTPPSPPPPAIFTGPPFTAPPLTGCFLSCDSSPSSAASSVVRSPQKVRASSDRSAPNTAASASAASAASAAFAVKSSAPPGPPGPPCPPCPPPPPLPPLTPARLTASSSLTICAWAAARPVLSSPSLPTSSSSPPMRRSFPSSA
jgi:hypothetical protein